MKVFVNERMLISGEEWIPNTQAEFEANVKQLLSVLNCFNFLNQTQIYYNSEGIGLLIANFNIVGEEYFLFNPIDQLRNLLIDIDAIDWNLNKIHRNDYSYFIQLAEGAITHLANTTTIAEATEYSFLNNKVLLINLFSSEINQLPSLYVNRVNINPPKDMQLLELKMLSEKEETIRYTLNNHKQPQFSFNPKHGENNKGVWNNKDEEVSPLLCSKEEAEEFLKISVGSKKTNELYAYDWINEKFIVFKNESNNLFHPYHPIDQDEVPAEVKDFILTSSVLNPQNILP